MSDPVTAASDYIVAHRDWAPLAFGLLALGESTAGIGIVVPATPLLFLIGSLVGGGSLDAAPVLAWGMAGAVAGYWLSWAVGRHVGHRIYRLPVLRDHRRGGARARLFFHRHGGAALILGRFLLGPFQSLLPLAAGIAAMDARRFHLWSAASAVIWVLVCLAPGFLSARGFVALGLGGRGQSMLVAGLCVVSGGAVLLTLGTAAWRLWRRGASGPA